jgi:hypothetical protein
MCNCRNRTKECRVGRLDCDLAKQMSESSSNALLYGGAYNFKNQPERLKYVGQDRGWHQFEKIGQPGVWCELLDSDLHMIEETKDTIKCPDCEKATEQDDNSFTCHYCKKTWPKGHGHEQRI